MQFYYLSHNIKTDFFFKTIAQMWMFLSETHTRKNIFKIGYNPKLFSSFGTSLLLPHLAGPERWIITVRV